MLSSGIHEDVATTQIYTHVMNRPGLGVRSPLDALGAAGEWRIEPPSPGCGEPGR